MLSRYRKKWVALPMAFVGLVVAIGIWLHLSRRPDERMLSDLGPGWPPPGSRIAHDLEYMPANWREIVDPPAKSSLKSPKWGVVP